MKEGGRNIRRAGVVGAVGLAVASVVGCGNETPKPTLRVDATLKPAELYDHRIAVQRDENLIVCFTDELPMRDGVKWAFVADEAYCPDTRVNLVFLNEEGPIISPFRLDFKRFDNYAYTPQWSYRRDRKEIPPVDFGN